MGKEIESQLNELANRQNLNFNYPLESDKSSVGFSSKKIPI